MNTTKESPYGTNRKTAAIVGMLFILTIGGGVAFWVTTIATSLLPIAAEYRAAFSNWSIQTVWVDSLLVGMIIGCCVSYSLLRFIDKNPTKNPILKSTILSCIALVIATLLIDVPRSIIGPSHALYYFLIGVIFNVVRLLFLGLAIGYLYKRLYGVARTNCSHWFVRLFPIQRR
jgi:asparagine N-glycosylation enzyme membrane subunit Stt3